METAKCVSRGSSQAITLSAEPKAPAKRMAAEVELSKGAKLTAEGSPRNLARVLKMITRKASWATDNDEESHEKMTTPLPGRGPARPPSHGRKRSLLRTLSFTRREIPSVTTLSSSSVETSPEGSQVQKG